jgi:intracellular sulfur oxidation DsrE/DsrF family protein
VPGTPDIEDTIEGTRSATVCAGQSNKESRMTHNLKISDEFLNSFIDNELESDEKSEIFDSISQDDALKQRTCELRGLKAMVQHAYQQPPLARKKPKEKRPGYRFPYIQSLAASLLLLLLGGTSGWLISASSKSEPKLVQMYQEIQSNNLIEDTGKIIVQVSNSNPVRLRTALDETESLLETYRRANRQLKVEIIANGSGVDLLRSDVSPYVARIGLMKAKYPNLDFLACSQTVGLLQKKGVVVHLLPHTGMASSAVEEINKRLQQGWDYVRV